MYQTFHTTALVNKGFITIDGDCFAGCEYRKIALERFKEMPDGTFRASYGMYSNEDTFGTFIVLDKLPQEPTSTTHVRIHVEIPEKWRSEMRYVCPVCTSTNDFDVSAELTVRLGSMRYKKTGHPRIRNHPNDPIKNARMYNNRSKCTCRNCGYTDVLGMFKSHCWVKVNKGV